MTKLSRKYQYHSTFMRRTFVCNIRSFRGDRTKATSEVENSISKMAISPSLDSETFEKGSVV